MIAHSPTLKEEIAAALDWWQDAGVDANFNNDATDWLADTAPTPEPTHALAGRPKKPEQAEAKKPASVTLLGDNPPDDLAEFQKFWMSEPKLALAGSSTRVPPRGKAGAKLMVLVATPEQGDSEMLLSMAQGRLLSKILEAVRVAQNEVYFASAVPQVLPLADGHELHEAGFAEVLAHHVSLVSPERILVFGTNILPLITHDAAQQPETVHKFSASGADVPLLVAEGLDALAGMPRLKARFWRRWLAHLASQ